MMKIYKWIIICSLILFNVQILWAQTTEIDSLRQVISLLEKQQGYEKDTSYFRALHNLQKSLYVYPDKRDSCALIAEKMVQLAQNANDAYWEAKGYHVLAYYYSRGRDIPKATIYFTEKVLPTYRKLQKPELAVALRHYGNLLTRQNLLDTALATYYESLQIFNQMPLNARMSGDYEAVLERVGDVQQALGEKQKAKKHYEEALRFIDQHHPQSDGKSSILTNMNYILIEEKRFDEAIQNFHTVLKITPQNLPSVLFNAYKGLGTTYKALRQSDSTKKYFHQAEKIARQLPDKANLCFILHSLAVLHIDENDLESALRTEEEALALAQKMNMRENMKVNYGLLSDIYQSKGDYRKALKYHQAFKSLSDSLAGEQNNREIGKLEAKYEFDKQTNELKAEQARKNEVYEAQAKQQRIILFSALLFVALVLAFAFFIYRSRQKIQIAKEEIQQKNEEITTQSEQLAQANATKDKLFSIISHDLRSPLSSMKNSLDLLEDQVFTQEEFLEVSRSVGDNVKRLFFMLENLLQWSYSQIRGEYIAQEKFDINEIVQQNQELFADIYRAKNITFEQTTEENTMVFAEKNQIDLVLRNLISNAIKFTSNGGKISVSVHKKANEIQVAIRDTGIGISSENLHKLFGFSAVEVRKGTENEKGTGLGLMLCKEMIEKNKGKIWAESKENEGTTFYFTLPISS